MRDGGARGGDSGTGRNGRSPGKPIPFCSGSTPQCTRPSALQPRRPTAVIQFRGGGGYEICHLLGGRSERSPPGPDYVGHWGRGDDIFWIGQIEGLVVLSKIKIISDSLIAGNVFTVSIGTHHLLFNDQHLYFFLHLAPLRRNFFPTSYHVTENVFGHIARPPLVCVTGVFLPWPGQRVCVGEYRPEPPAAARGPRSPGGGAHEAAGRCALLPRGRGARLPLLHLRTLPLRAGGSCQADCG